MLFDVTCIKLFRKMPIICPNTIALPGKVCYNMYRCGLAALLCEFHYQTIQGRTGEYGTDGMGKAHQRRKERTALS